MPQSEKNPPAHLHARKIKENLNYTVVNHSYCWQAFSTFRLNRREKRLSRGCRTAPNSFNIVASISRRNDTFYQPLLNHCLKIYLS